MTEPSGGGTKRSLVEFAAQSGRLPPNVLAEVNEGLRKGVGPTIVCRWLISEGYETTPARLSHHKQGGHSDIG